MRKAFSLVQVAILAIIGIVIFKIVIPKLSGVKNDALVMASISDLKRAIKDISDYEYLNNSFSSIAKMTYVHSFDNEDEKLEDGRQFQFIVGSGKNTPGHYCTVLTFHSNPTPHFTFQNTSDTSSLCNDFRNTPDYQNYLQNGASLVGGS